MEINHRWLFFYNCFCLNTSFFSHGIGLYKKTIIFSSDSNLVLAKRLIILLMEQGIRLHLTNSDLFEIDEVCAVEQLGASFS